MAISEKRESLNKGNIGKQEKASPPKEEGKDTSLFKGEPHVTRGTGRSWAEGDEIYRLTKIPREKRSEIWGKITKDTGIHFQKSEAEKIYRDIKDHPIGSKEKYGIKNEKERRSILEMLGKSLGK